MNFLAMIIALVLLRTREFGGPVQRDNWFRALQNSVRGLGLSSTLGMLIYLALPVFIAQWVLGLLQPMLFGLLWIGAAVVILLYAFGREDYQIQTENYRASCLDGNLEAAYQHAQNEWGAQFSPEDLALPGTVNRAMQRELLYVGYQRWFAVLFYFFLLGPAGALVYRLLQLSKEGPEQDLANRLLFYVDWLPVRLLAAGFALTGDFLGSRDELLASVTEPDQQARGVLLEVGRAAITAPEMDVSSSDASFYALAATEIGDLGALQRRSAGAWLLVISLLVLVA